jgi:hypothetical protein
MQIYRAVVTPRVIRYHFVMMEGSPVPQFAPFISSGFHVKNFSKLGMSTAVSWLVTQVTYKKTIYISLQPFIVG